MGLTIDGTGVMLLFPACQADRSGIICSSSLLSFLLHVAFFLSCLYHRRHTLGEVGGHLSLFLLSVHLTPKATRNRVSNVTSRCYGGRGKNASTRRPDPDALPPATPVSAGGNV